MKRFHLLIALTILCNVLGAQSNKLSIYAQSLLNDDQARPHYLLFKEQYRVNEKEAQTFLTALLFAENGTTLSKVNAETDELGFTHVRYQVLFQTIPIQGKVIVAHFREQRLQSINGELFAFNAPLAKFYLSEQSALSAALKKVGAKKYKWENKEEERFMAQTLNQPDFSYQPTAEKVFLQHNGQLHSAYKFNIYAEEPLYRADVYVDAANAKVLNEINHICTVNTPGTAATKYSGTQTITCDLANNQHTLRENARGLGVETYNLFNTMNYALNNFTSTTSTWSLSTFDQGALDAHWGAERTYDYYLNIHNRNSINNAGFKLISFVHYGTNYQNAFWDGQRMTYGDGGGSYKIFTALDVCGHEISHGLTSNTSNLMYQNESGALNESYSDIFGASIENFARPSNWNWKIGEDLTNSGAGLRTMANPNQFGDPDTYGGNSWYTGTADNGGVHTNSGVSNYWYYLLTQGGSGTNDIGNTFSVTGIGFNSASRIAFRALTVYYTPTTNYATARLLSIQAAKDLFGDCSNETIQTINAWHAVGIGNKFTPGVIGSDFKGDALNLCSVPATVNFTNLTPYATSYKWNFGDGSPVSTASNAVHTYTTGGSFNVKLKAIGCGNQADSITKPAYITVNIAPSPQLSTVIACLNMPATLTATGNNNIQWFDAPGGNIIGTGSTITTPLVTNPTTFYAANAIPNQPAFGGILTPTGGGYQTSNTPYQIFNVVQSGTLNSVVVYAGGPGTRTVELRDASNQVLYSIPFTLTAGANTLQLWIPLQVGTNYRLALAAGTSNLYRSTLGVNYPYSIGGCVNIVGSSAGLTSYYWFYKWEVTREDCLSPLVPVSVVPKTVPVVSMNGITGPVCLDDRINLSGSPAGGSFSGAGVSGTTFAGTGLMAGTFTVSYTYSDANGCYATDSKVLNASECTGLDKNAGVQWQSFPNPVKDRLYFQSENGQHLQLSLVDLSGRVIFAQTIDTAADEVDLSSLASGAYLIKFSNAQGALLHTAKLVKE